MAKREQVMVKIDGKSFRCSCGCNVFTVNPHDGYYDCNSCDLVYEGEGGPNDKDN